MAPRKIDSFVVELAPEDWDRLARRKELVRQTWRAVELGLDVRATRQFYVKLFQKYPEIKPHFNNVNMELQAKKLHEVFKVAVRFLDNMDQLVPTLKDLGIRHARCYGVKREHYDAVTDSFIRVLNELVFCDWKQGLEGSIRLLDIADAWSWVLTFIGNTMADAADEDMQKPKAVEDTPSDQAAGTSTTEASQKKCYYKVLATTDSYRPRKKAKSGVA